MSGGSVGEAGRGDAELWVVAGCLFEVALPAAGPTSPWRWVPRAEVTLLEDGVRGGSHHFRFRAEAGAAAVGWVPLRFAGSATIEAMVTVRVAAERIAGD